MAHKSKYTAEQLITAYRLYKQVDGVEASKQSGIPYKSLGILMKDIEWYLSGKKVVSKRTSSTYREVVRTLNQGGVQQPIPTTNGQAKPIHTDTNNLQKLEEAFQMFQEAIVDVIVAEAEQRAKQQVQSKEKELAEQKEFYEKELIKLQTIITSAKDSSIVGMVKKKWAQ